MRQALNFIWPGSQASAQSGNSQRLALMRRAAQMVGWRMAGLAFGALGSIWAARCLGPGKLGISGMIVATITQLVLLVDLNQNAHLIRLYKGADEEEARKDLVAGVFAFRLALCLAIMGLAGLTLLCVPLNPDWRLGLIAAFPLFFVTCNQGIWVAQAQENQSAQYRAGAAQGLVAAVIYLSLFRPGVAPGWDVLVQAAAVGSSWVLLWLSTGFSFRDLFRRVQWGKTASLLKGGRWLMLTGVVVYIYTQLESPLIGYLTSIEEVGRYRSATSLVNVAQSFLSMIPILLYPRFLEWLKAGVANLWRKQIQLASVAVVITIPAALATYFLAPIVYRLVYGPAFVAAALPFTFLLVAKFVVVINGIFGWGLWAMKRDKQMLAVMLATAVISMTGNLFFIPRFGMIAAAEMNLFSEIVILLGCFWLSRRAFKQATA